MSARKLGYKTVSLLFLAGFLVSSSALACEVKSGHQSGFLSGQVYEFGDLKLKVAYENVNANGSPGPDYYATFDLKAPPKYLKRGVNLKPKEAFTETICGQEITITLRSPSFFEVSSF